METQEYTSKTLDHLGLVAGMCQEIGISQLIDQDCPSESPDQIVSTGKALEAMILNGLGFVNKRLYLVSRFFEDKPIDRLLGPEYEASHFNDDRLGRALDQLYATGLTTLFTKLSRQVFKVIDYRPTRGHLDSTSLSVHGRYNSEESEVSGLHITQGYSKDNRPDLPQVTLQLICEHISGIPMHMEALNGNSSDSESFRNTILNFGKQLHSEDGLTTIVADSKLYCKETLQVLQDSRLNWICRVPGTLDAVKGLLEEVESAHLYNLKEYGAEGYSSACYTFTYAEVDQHWVVYHSQSAAQREAKALQRHLNKEGEQAHKSLKKLMSQVFHCRKDALQAAEQCEQKWKWHKLEGVQVKEVKKHNKPGRPSTNDKPVIQYMVDAKVQVKQAQLDKEAFKRSLFVLATNQSIDTLEQECQLLQTYKEQHSVERGFRFIKDPNIVASSFYVQKPERVAALTFVMACCLLVYATLEYRIRQSLEKEDQAIPDQKGKPTKKPTARWVFQLFVGIHELKLPNENKLVLNLNENHRKIISLLSYWQFYT
jgi:transposase